MQTRTIIGIGFAILLGSAVTIHTGVKFHDGSPLTAADIAASWHEIVVPRPGVLSARQNWYTVVDAVEAPDATTVVQVEICDQHVPAIACGPLYPKAILDKDPHWFEQHVMGSGPFKFVAYDIGQDTSRERSPDYYHKGLPYLDGVVGIFAEKQVVRVEAIHSGRAAMEFRGLPSSAISDLKRALGEKIRIQTSDSGLTSPPTGSCDAGRSPRRNSPDDVLALDTLADMVNGLSGR
jgi:peptide/nickel transport system substrate-binding protein